MYRRDNKVNWKAQTEINAWENRGLLIKQNMQ